MRRSGDGKGRIAAGRHGCRTCRAGSGRRRERTSDGDIASETIGAGDGDGVSG